VVQTVALQINSCTQGTHSCL